MSSSNVFPVPWWYGKSSLVETLLKNLTGVTKAAIQGSPEETGKLALDWDAM